MLPLIESPPAVLFLHIQGLLVRLICLLHRVNRLIPEGLRPR